MRIGSFPGTLNSCATVQTRHQRCASCGTFTSSSVCFRRSRVLELPPEILETLSLGTCTHTHRHDQTHTYTHIYIYTHRYKYMCIHIMCIHIYINKYVYMYMHLYMYIHIHADTDVRIYLTHTCSGPQAEVRAQLRGRRSPHWKEVPPRVARRSFVSPRIEIWLHL